MDSKIQRYEIEQGEKKYNLSTQVKNGKLRLICEELNIENPSAYIGEYLLVELIQLTSLFASISNISEAQNIFENIITNQKVSVEEKEKNIILKIFIKKEDGIEEYFSLQLNLFNKNTPNIQNNISSPTIKKEMFSQKRLLKQNPSYSTNKFINKQKINFSSNNNKQQLFQLPPKTISVIGLNNRKLYNSNSYKNIQLHKSKRTQLDTLTLSLRAEPKTDKNNNNKKILVHSPSAENIHRPYIEQNKPLIHQKKINTNTVTDINNIELENLKIENNKLNNEIIKLNNKIEILNQENKILNQKNNNSIKIIENGNQKILTLKTEIERFLKEINILKTEFNEFEEYRKLKEEEIKSLKIQIKELLINQKQLEEYQIYKQKQIEELKLFINELIQKQKKDNNQYTEINKDKEDTLTIQDTRLEIIKGDIIQNVKELELLTRKIGKNNKKIILNLLYKATIDSDKAEIFHKKCDSAKSTLVLIKSKNGKRFGGYTTCDWKGNSIDKKDNKAFIFSLDKMNIYDIIPNENAIGCHPKYGPIFFQIIINDCFFDKGGCTFKKGVNYYTKEDYELTGGFEKFEVKEIEVYSVELK